MTSNRSHAKNLAPNDSVPVKLRTVLLVDHCFELMPGEARRNYMQFLRDNNDRPGYTEAHREILAINARNRNARSR